MMIQVPDSSQEAAAVVAQKVHGAVDTLAYQAGRSREKVAVAIGPRWRAVAGVLAAVVGLSFVLAGRRRRRRS